MPGDAPQHPGHGAAPPQRNPRARPFPRSRSPRALARTAVLLALPAAAWLAGAGRAAADPSGSPSPSSSPSDDACNGLTGQAYDICNGGSPDGSGPSAPDASSVTDPLGALAKGCAQAASWVINHLAGTIDDSTKVDFTNVGFLHQYAVVFAASTILTLVLWLLAVTKRAVRGIPLHEAFTEAIGFLWLTVIASAFTPLVLYTLVKVTDAVTEAIAMGTKADTKKFLGGFASALDPDKIGGGPIMTIVVSLLSIVAAAVLWIELLVRAAMLYVGALLGTAVYSGLVDKKLWQHVRRWAGLMLAVILLKPVIIIVLGLAGAVSGSGGKQDSFTAILSGLAILFLSIFASAMIYRFVPGFGDEMAAMHNHRGNPAARVGSAMVTGPANFVRQGIRTHAARNTAAEAASDGGGGGGKAGDAIAGGVAAHAQRAPAQAPKPAPEADGKTAGGDR